MRNEIAKAHADTLTEWAESWKTSGVEGAGEIAFLMGRAARLLGMIARNEPLPAETLVPDQNETLGEPAAEG